MISALILTDELFTAKEAAQSNAQANQNDVVDEVSEAQIQKMISKLGSRITHITKEVEAL